MATVQVGSRIEASIVWMEIGVFLWRVLLVHFGFLLLFLRKLDLVEYGVVVEVFGVVRIAR